jgi:hypothetical protein
VRCSKAFSDEEHGDLSVVLVEDPSEGIEERLDGTVDVELSASASLEDDGEGDGADELRESTSELASSDELDGADGILGALPLDDLDAALELSGDVGRVHERRERQLERDQVDASTMWVTAPRMFRALASPRKTFWSMIE